MLSSATTPLSHCHLPTSAFVPPTRFPPVWHRFALFCSFCLFCKAPVVLPPVPMSPFRYRIGSDKLCIHESITGELRFRSPLPALCSQGFWGCIHFVCISTNSNYPLALQTAGLVKELYPQLGMNTHTKEWLQQFMRPSPSSLPLSKQEQIPATGPLCGLLVMFVWLLHLTAQQLYPAVVMGLILISIISYWMQSTRSHTAPAAAAAVHMLWLIGYAGMFGAYVAHKMQPRTHLNKTKWFWTLTQHCAVWDSFGTTQLGPRAT